jgi:flap endonuclease GEN
LFNCIYFREERKHIIAELKMRRKALQDVNFPSQALVDEFLHRQPVPELDLNWKQPDIVSFIVSVSC